MTEVGTTKKPSLSAIKEQDLNLINLVEEAASNDDV